MSDLSRKLGKASKDARMTFNTRLTETLTKILDKYQDQLENAAKRGENYIKISSPKEIDYDGIFWGFTLAIAWNVAK